MPTGYELLIICSGRYSVSDISHMAAQLSFLMQPHRPCRKAYQRLSPVMTSQRLLKHSIWLAEPNMVIRRVEERDVVHDKRYAGASRWIYLGRGILTSRRCRCGKLPSGSAPPTSPAGAISWLVGAAFVGLDIVNHWDRAAER